MTQTMQKPQKRFFVPRWLIVVGIALIFGVACIIYIVNLPKGEQDNKPQKNDISVEEIYGKFTGWNNNCGAAKEYENKGYFWSNVSSFNVSKLTKEQLAEADTLTEGAKLYIMQNNMKNAQISLEVLDNPDSSYRIAILKIDRMLTKYYFENRATAVWDTLIFDKETINSCSNYASEDAWYAYEDYFNIAGCVDWTECINK